MSGSIHRLVDKQRHLIDRLLELTASTSDSVALQATKDALDRIERYEAAFGRNDDERSVTADELAEAMDIAKRLKK
jgi:hypothetical protein